MIVLLNPVKPCRRVSRGSAFYLPYCFQCCSLILAVGKGQQTTVLATFSGWELDKEEAEGQLKHVLEPEVPHVTALPRRKARALSLQVGCPALHTPVVFSYQDVPPPWLPCRLAWFGED